MAIEFTQLELNRWNSDDAARSILADAHWDRFFEEPRWGRRGVESRRHHKYRMALRTLRRASEHLRLHTAELRSIAEEFLAR